MISTAGEVKIVSNVPLVPSVFFPWNPVSFVADGPLHVVSKLGCLILLKEAIQDFCENSFHSDFCSLLREERMSLVKPHC